MSINGNVRRLKAFWEGPGAWQGLEANPVDEQHPSPLNIFKEFNSSVEELRKLLPGEAGAVDGKMSEEERVELTFMAARARLSIDRAVDVLKESRAEPVTVEHPMAAKSSSDRISNVRERSPIAGKASTTSKDSAPHTPQRSRTARPMTPVSIPRDCDRHPPNHVRPLQGSSSQAQQDVFHVGNNDVQPDQGESATGIAPSRAIANTPRQLRTPPQTPASKRERDRDSNGRFTSHAAQTSDRKLSAPVQRKVTKLQHQPIPSTTGPSAQSKAPLGNKRKTSQVDDSSDDEEEIWNRNRVHLKREEGRQPVKKQTLALSTPRAQVKEPQKKRPMPPTRSLKAKHSGRLRVDDEVLVRMYFPPLPHDDQVDEHGRPRFHTSWEGPFTICRRSYNRSTPHCSRWNIELTATVSYSKVLYPNTIFAGTRLKRWTGKRGPDDYEQPVDPNVGPAGRGEDGEKEWEIETIVAERRRGLTGMSYLVRWEGWGNREMRWLSSTELMKSAKEILDWWNAMKQEGFVQM